jgi:Flp pilus assembly protein TadG
MLYSLPHRLKPLFLRALDAALQCCSTQRPVPAAFLKKKQIPPVACNDRVDRFASLLSPSQARLLATPSAGSGQGLSLSRQGRGTRRLEFGSEAGATLAEFAFTLPILVLILYGIFDFGSALVLKQKLEHVAYEAARTAASQSTDDLSNGVVGTSGSVADLRDTVAQNLQNAGVDDCGLLGAAPTSSNVVTSTFIYNVSGGACPAALILTIRRQQVTTVGGVSVVFSRITLQYPFQYHVAGILKVVAPGSSFPTSANLVVNSTMKNLT